jgi:hypothetical protein
MLARIFCWTLNAVFLKPGGGIDQEIELQIERSDGKWAVARCPSAVQ